MLRAHPRSLTRLCVLCVSLRLCVNQKVERSALPQGLHETVPSPSNTAFLLSIV